MVQARAVDETVIDEMKNTKQRKDGVAISCMAAGFAYEERHG